MTMEEIMSLIEENLIFGPILQLYPKKKIIIPSNLGENYILLN